jgi:hypothetical protein
MDGRESLCEWCVHMQEVVTGKGSRFLLCHLAVRDPRFPKYPPQPVRQCSAFEARRPEQQSGRGSEDSP